jgi:hypothetical protein
MSPRLALIVAAIAVAGAAAYLALRSPPDRDGASGVPRREPATPPRPEQVGEPPPARSSNEAAAELAGDKGVEPHPVTSVRSEEAEQRALFRALEHALAHRDFARARDLVREHERRFAGAGGWPDDRRAYEHVLDCLEHPGAESRARGERFIELNRASTLRRRVREACLGAREPVLLPAR